MGVSFDPRNGSGRQPAESAGEFPPDEPPGYFEPPKPRRDVFLIAKLAAAGVAVAALLGLVAFAEFSGDLTSRAAQVDANNNVVKSGTLDVGALNIGGCFDEPSTADQSTVDGVEAVPCAQPHDAQVIGIYMLSDDSYNQATIQSEANTACQNLASGSTVNQAELSKDANVVSFAPTADSWTNLDRRVTCAVDEGSGKKRTGSVMK